MTIDNSAMLEYKFTFGSTAEFRIICKRPLEESGHMNITKPLIKQKFLFLLISLTLFLVVNPFLVESRFQWSNYLFNILFSIVLIISVWTIEHKRHTLIIAIILAALVFFGHWLLTFLNLNTYFYLLNYLITITFFLLITIIAIRKIIYDKHISANTLYGAISGYLLIGLIWSFIYTILYSLDQSAFLFPSHFDLPSFQIRNQHFIYYSFVTLSTLGYGDITPLTNGAKTFSWLEAIIGQIYLTVWIAHLVGMYVSDKKSRMS